MNSRSLQLVSALALLTTASSGDWSPRADLPGNPRLSELDGTQARSRYVGCSKAEIDAALGPTARQILVPTADSGWIEWDAGSPDHSQAWVYSLRRTQSRGGWRGDALRENRRLVLNFDGSGTVVSTDWSCDTTIWRPKS